MTNQSMAQASMSRSGYHISRSDGTPHYTIQRDNSAPRATLNNNIGHVYADGAAKACGGGSILWTLPRVKS